MKLGKDSHLYRILITIQIISALLIVYFLFVSEDIMIFILILTENVIITAMVGLIVTKNKNDEFSKAEKKFIASVLEISKDDKDIKFNCESGDMFENIYKALESALRDIRDREKMREEVLRIINTAAAYAELSKMLSELIPKIAVATQSDWAAFYQSNDITNKLELKYSTGFGKNIYNEFDVSIGEGFIGKAALTKTIHIINNIPEDTMFATRTVLGKIWPKNLMFIPVFNQEMLLGVIVLGSVYEYTNYNRELLSFVNYYLGLAIGNGITYERTRRLTNELQFQNKLIQSLNEELEYKVRERTTFLNSVIDAMHDYAIYAIDKNGFINSWNKTAEKIFGYTAEEAIGEIISELFVNEELSIEGIEQRLETVKIHGRLEEKTWRILKNGRKCYLDLILSPMYDEKNEFLGLTCISKEIHEE